MDKRLSIITIGIDNYDEIINTCKSVDNQSELPYEHIIIATFKDNLLLDKLQFECKKIYRIFIFNKDKSLYNAMNLGIINANGKYILFLNSGDLFYTNYAISKFYQKQNGKSVIIFRSIQTYDNLKFIRKKLRYINDLKLMPAHQSFIAPIDIIKSNNIYFNENNLISADAEWMQCILNHTDCKIIPFIFSEFKLGGLSNMPTLKTIFIKYNQNSFKTFLNEIIKFIIKNIFGYKTMLILTAKKNNYLIKK